jgi:hypothetical protein
MPSPRFLHEGQSADSDRRLELDARSKVGLGLALTPGPAPRSGAA